MQKQKTISKAKQDRVILLERVKKIKKKLPEHWTILFIHQNPEYKGQTIFLHNVMCKKSLHLPTIEKIENWVQTLKNK